MGMTIEEVVMKVKKLLALSNSTNEHEAALAAARAQKLMDEYKVSMADVDKAVYEQVDPIGHVVSAVNGSALWKRGFMAQVARINGCVCVTNRTKKGNARAKVKHITLIGRESDRQVVEYMVTYLIREIERLGEVKFEAYSRVNKRQQEVFLGLTMAPQAINKKTYMNSFALGAVAAIVERMQAERDQFKQGSAAGGALVIYDAAAAEKHMNEMYGDLKSEAKRKVNVNGHAYWAGHKEGQKMAWKKGMGGGGGEQKVLGAA